MNICILIPVYNEAKNIGTLVKAVSAKGLDVIVIDDGSSDGSGELARQQGAFVIRHIERHGKGHALQSGFECILERGYEALIIMDGDGQHAVDDLEKFLNHPYLTAKCVITGNRMHDPKEMPWVRFLTNHFMSFMISLACRQKIPDTQCGFRLIGRDVLKALEITCDGFEIETEILIKASKKGFPIYSVPIKTIYEDEESKISPLRDTFRFVKYFTKEIFTFGKRTDLK